MIGTLQTSIVTCSAFQRLMKDVTCGVSILQAFSNAVMATEKGLRLRLQRGIGCLSKQGSDGVEGSCPGTRFSSQSDQGWAPGCEASGYRLCWTGQKSLNEVQGCH